MKWSCALVNGSPSWYVPPLLSLVAIGVAVVEKNGFSLSTDHEGHVIKGSSNIMGRRSLRLVTIGKSC